MAQKIILCCDGTGQDSSAMALELNPKKTNVRKIFDCIKQTPSQWKEYVHGVGEGFGLSMENNVNRRTKWFRQTVFGHKIEDNIKAGYECICNNYRNPGDEIILIGFSRGAYTARGLARMITDVGVLKRVGLTNYKALVDEIFHKWLSQPNAEGRDYCKNIQDEFVQAHGSFIFRDVRIRACGLWDSVRFDSQSKLAFIDSELGDNVDFAFHALALNEQRSPFGPMLFVNARGNQDLKQCWFVGHHSDIAGNRPPSITALVWLIAQLEEKCSLEFDKSKIKELIERGPLEGGKLKLKDSQKLYLRNKIRTPGKYSAGSPEETKELIHWSVHEFLKDNLVVDCPARPLDEFSRSAEGVWVNKADAGIRIPEERPNRSERRLCEMIQTT